MACSSPTDRAYDILIKNGQIIDGSGEPAYVSDVGVNNNEIVAIGDLKNTDANKIIDAEGLVVSPGFIDIHTHCDEAFDKESNNANLNYLIQGVTTVVTGNCGYGTYEITKTKADWETRGIGTNAVMQIENFPVRKAIMGEDQLREPTDEEIAKMQDLIRQAMKEGAWGISTGLEYGGYDKFVTTKEVIELTKPIAEFDGFYNSHIRDEATYLVEAVDEVIEISEATGVPANISHIKACGKDNWGRMEEAIQHINDARERGLAITADQYPFLQGDPIDYITGLIDVPSELETLRKLKNDNSEAFNEELIKTLENETKRELIKKSTYEKRDVDSSPVARWGWQDFRIKVAPNHPQLVDKMIVDLIEEEGRDGFDIVADLIIEDPNILFASSSQSVEDNKLAMTQDWVMVSSDGLAYPIIGEDEAEIPNHPRDFASQTIVHRKYVREEGLLTLENAVRKMTALPAKFLKMKDRGLIKEGYKADITIFNPKTIQDNATYDNAFEYATGVEYVLVNGKISVDKGSYNNGLNGKVLLKK